MKNNPEWKPFLEAVKAMRRDVTPISKFRDSTPVSKFLDGYPERLRPVAALALSLAKWYLAVSEGRGSMGVVDCGCCCYYCHGDVYHGGCLECPLGSRHDATPFCYVGTPTEIYTRIHRVYTEHFSALPARDRQKVA